MMIFSMSNIMPMHTKKDLDANKTPKPRDSILVEKPDKAPTNKNNIKIYNCQLDADIQEWAQEQCYIYHIEFNIVLAIIEVESNFNKNAIGDKGNSIGLMQIQPRWHKKRMLELNCSNLQNPKENIKVGIDFLAELYKKHGNYTDALREYNGGTNWQNISITKNYAKKVLAKARQYRRK